MLKVAAAVVLVACASAHAQTLYALDSGKTLMTLDVTTGASTVIGAGDYQDQFGGFGVGLAFDPTTGTMFSRSFDNLYTLDQNTGTTTLVGSSPDFITGLTFNAAMTTLYSVGQSSGNFVQVNPATGSPTVVGNMGVTTPLGLTTRSDGTVFMSTFGGDIYTVNEGTGAVSLQAAGVGGGLTEIAFDGNDVLYGVTLDTDELGTIDLATGVFTPIGPVGFTDIRGLAFVGTGCFADCDGSGDLTILDFVCFRHLFQNGDAAADCDGNGVLNVLDFVCFQLAFQAGCP